MIVKIGLPARLAGMEVIDFGNFSNPITHVRRPAQPRGAGPSQLSLSLSHCPVVVLNKLHKTFCDPSLPVYPRVHNGMEY